MGSTLGIQQPHIHDQKPPTSADNWIYWRVFSFQEVTQEKYYRQGEWSQVNTYRVPDDQGYDDGAGNHTVNLSSGSIFSDTGLLPAAPDAHTVPSALNTNYGGSTTLKLGASSSGDHEIFIEFDLSQMPWPSAMTPTSTMLRLYRTHRYTYPSRICAPRARVSSRTPV